MYFEAIRKQMKCKCIANTTIQGINVGEEYQYNIVNGAYEIIYNETEKTFERVYGNVEWFNHYFEKI